MRVVNERWNELENELGLGLPLNTLSEVDIANKWQLRALNAEKLLNKPQLTIPKSIADELEKYDFELTSKGLMYRNIGDTLVEFSRVTYDEIPQLIVQTIAGNYRIVFAYLAGFCVIYLMEQRLVNGIQLFLLSLYGNSMSEL